MKKIILILTFILILVIPIKVFAGDNQGISIDEEEKIESLYNYITNMKSKYEILNDLDVRQFVENFLQTGDGGISNKDIYIKC